MDRKKAKLLQYFQYPVPSSRLDRARELLNCSPTLRYISTLLFEIVDKSKRRVVILAQSPVVCWIIYMFTMNWGLPSVWIRAGTGQAERDTIVNKLNNPKAELKVLITTHEAIADIRARLGHDTRDQSKLGADYIDGFAQSILRTILGWTGKEMASTWGNIKQLDLKKSQLRPSLWFKFRGILGDASSGKWNLRRKRDADAFENDAVPGGYQEEPEDNRMKGLR
ncbi:hypothetical protein FQN49_001732 [Arthroderma sp. PD_2]|nr:hypothetical protein FQN49_001732 [Arthroderma sp. PD_2]